jgi:CheY-like chemotaxis protein
MDEEEKKGPVILLADDEDVIRMMGRDILRVLGYEVMLASNGEETIEVYQKNAAKIALILLDWHMPGMKGIEILERLWAIDEKVKVILATGWGPPKELDDIRASGHQVGLLQKPYLVKDLQNEISAFLAK